MTSLLPNKARDLKFWNNIHQPRCVMCHMSQTNKQKIQESQKATPRKSHRLLRCQVVFIKRCHYYYCHYCRFHYCQNLIFWFLSQFDFFLFWSQMSFWVLSAFEFLSFVTIYFFLFFTIWVIEFGFNLSFCWVLSQFEWLSFVTIWLFEFCHHLFLVLSQFELLSFVTNWVFEFCHNLSFGILSLFVFLSFITI